jgi:hypothetical protein
MSIKVSSKIPAIYEIMWESVVEPDWTQVTLYYGAYAVGSL